MTEFSEMGLPEALLHKLQHMEFTTPTPVQAEAIPLALQGKDILGSAQTGTGKTGAFAIPLIAMLLEDPRKGALILAPTRELARQVLDQVMVMLGRGTKIKSALVIGGEPMHKQISQLRRRPQIIVGTPGRINDHLERGTIDFDTTSYLVLDETDRMLDMGFSVQIDRILQHMPQERQTLLFSATLPKEIIRIANKYLNDPVHVAVASTRQPAENIDQKVMHLDQNDKYDALVNELNEREGSVIVFVKTRFATEKMARKLRQEGHHAEAIHGDLRQNRRDRVIAGMRNEKYRILVATDVAARGLDIPHIAHVINHDLPQVAEDFIHRIGRTARAGASGHALSMVSPEEEWLWRGVERLLYPEKNLAPMKKNGGGRRKKKFSAKRMGGGRPDSGAPRGRKPGGKFGGGKAGFDKARGDRSGEGRSSEGRSAEGRSSGGRDFYKKTGSDKAYGGRSEGQGGDGQQTRSRPHNGKKPAFAKGKKPNFRGDKKPDNGERGGNGSKPHSGKPRKFSGKPGFAGKRGAGGGSKGQGGFKGQRNAQSR